MQDIPGGDKDYSFSEPPSSKRKSDPPAANLDLSLDRSTRICGVTQASEATSNNSSTGLRVNPSSPGSSGATDATKSSKTLQTVNGLICYCDGLIDELADLNKLLRRTLTRIE